MMTSRSKQTLRGNNVLSESTGWCHEPSLRIYRLMSWTLTQRQTWWCFIPVSSWLSRPLLLDICVCLFGLSSRNLINSLITGDNEPTLRCKARSLPSSFRFSMFLVRHPIIWHWTLLLFYSLLRRQQTPFSSMDTNLRHHHKKIMQCNPPFLSDIMKLSTRFNWISFRSLSFYLCLSISSRSRSTSKTWQKMEGLRRPTKTRLLKRSERSTTKQETRKLYCFHCPWLFESDYHATFSVRLDIVGLVSVWLLFVASSTFFFGSPTTCNLGRRKCFLF